jgi:hypothetical protein
MNIISKTLIMAGLSSLMAFPASAEFIDIDWLTPGDQAATYDTTSGLSWLKLDNTFNIRYSTVIGELNTTYLGWRVPTVDEALLLMAQFDTLSPYNDVGYTTATDEVRKSFNDALGTNSTSDLTLGVAIVDGTYRVSGVRNPTSLYDFIYSNRIHSFVGGEPYSTFLVADGVFLETTIDAIAPLALSGLALLGFGLARRKKVTI